MGETCATLGNKRDTEIFNYEFIKGENVIWKLKRFKQGFTKG